MPFDFTKADFGELHNQSVLTALQHIKTQREAATVAPEKFTQADVYSEYYNQVKSLNTAPLGISNDSFYLHVVKLNQRLALAGYDVRNMSQSKSGLSPVAYNFVTGFLRSVSNANTLSAIEGSITDYKLKSQQLSGLDKDIVTGTLSVALSSARLWYSDNPLVQFARTRKAEGASARAAGWGTKMFLGDVSGSAGYFATLGWGAALGMGVPGANAVIFGGWAMAAGLTSVTALAGFYTVPWEVAFPGVPNPYVQYPNVIVDAEFLKTFVENEQNTK